MANDIDERTNLLSNHNASDINGDETSSNEYGSSAYSKEELQKTGGKIITYHRRWYILLIFGLMAFAQGWGWNTWGPIATSAKLALGWSNTHISLLVAWGPVMFMASVFGWSWLMQHKGLRVSCVLTSAIILSGAVLRCITLEPPLATWLINLGQVCYSLGGPVSMAGASVVSAAWFPASQRVTATALMSRIMAVGGMSTFVWGPNLVRDVTNLNETQINRTVLIDEIRSDIRRYMFIELGCAVFVFLAILAYFPDKPPTPPSVSTAVSQYTDFGKDLKKVFKHKQFWILSVPYSLSYGVYIGWSANMDVNLEPLHITQSQTGWLMYAGIALGSVASLLLARLVDYLHGKTKPVLFALYLGAALGSLGFALVCAQIIPLSMGTLYASRLLGALCMSCLPPLVFEVLNETTFPVPATVNNATVTFLKNACVLLFLVVLMVPSVGTVWMNWFMVASASICIPLLICFKENHNRLDVDDQGSVATGNIQSE